MRQVKAFTLIELLIVVAIIAILAAIAVPNFLEAQVRSKVSRAKADMRSIATALEAYAVDNNRYPPSGARQDGTLNGAPVTPPGGIRPYYDNVGPRIQRLAWVTTPVAFITSIQNDPFAVGSPESDPINRQHPVFVYWMPEQVDHYKFSNPLRFADLGPESTFRGAWALISYGPDKDFEASVSGAYLANYDPTNGTVSNGDVWRFGGSGIPN